MADRLELPTTNSQDQQQRIEAVLSYLEGTEETGERWLLIFDNAVPTFDSHDGVGALEDYWPRRGKCDVLITSREKVWGHLAEEQDVDVLTEDDAGQFLMERTGDEDESAARELARDLGYLPLALEQAGAFIKESRGQQTLASYRVLFRRKPLEHLTFDRSKVGKYAGVVATTWFISFEAIERQSPAAGDFLRLCAFLAPERIPLGDLIAHAEALPPHLGAILRDPDDGPRAVSLLLRYSLAETAGGGMINVHRLVQLVVREWLTDEERTTWARAALQAVDNAFPSQTNDPQQWETCDRLLPHVQSAVACADRGAADPTVAGLVLNRVGSYLRWRAQFQDARIAVERALALAEAVLGPQHPRVATFLNNLASVLYDQGDLAGVRSLAERALAIQEKALGLDHPDMAVSLTHLAGVLQEQGDLAGARGNYEQALALTEAAFGLEHYRVPESLNNLALVLQDQGDLAGAQERYERALAILEQVLGPDHPDVATCINNLALVLYDQGDLAGARCLIERALAIREKVLGPDHPDVAASSNRLARILRDQGDRAGARLLLERLLTLTEAALGPMHPHVAMPLIHLGDVLVLEGDLAGAQVVFLRAWRISLALPHPVTESQSLLRLGCLTGMQGRPDAGLKLLALSTLLDERVRSGRPDAEEGTLSIMLAQANALSYDRAQFDALFEEMLVAYRTDRGRSLVAAAFPKDEVERS